MPKQHRQAVHLPKGWTKRARSAVLQVISLAKYSLTVAEGWASENPGPASRPCGECQRLRQDLLLSREELRIKDARMAILELRAARSWSLAQTAKTFLVTQATISSWMHRLDEQGPNALVVLREPVNKFPDFVHYLVRRLRTLCPTMGKVKIAQTLARAGLHLGATTVGRMLKDDPRPTTVEEPANAAIKPHGVTARSPNHVWHIDLTTVPTVGGFWVTWFPFSMVQRWPFCWWVAVIVDHFSRRVMGLTVSPKQPTGQAVRELLGRTICQSMAQPKHLICDKGRQFYCVGLKDWCRRRKIRLRFGAVGKHGSIAVIERFILTLKQHGARWPLVPLKQRTCQIELRCFADWFNDCRPHTKLGGRTPNEVYDRRFPAVRRPRYEPRPRWPRGSPCAKPWALARSGPGAHLRLMVALHAGRRHLPIVTLKRAA